MNEDKPRKIVYVEKKSAESGLWYGRDVWYECPECGNKYDWLGRSRGGNTNRFCTGCGNYLSWAKLDYENYRETDSSFDKKMPFHKFLQDFRYGHTWEEEVSMTYSHSEEEILKGCISLMHELTGRFADYLEYIGVDPDSEEEIFSTRFSYGEIVKRLFLWKTTHSGGTSTGMKCSNLGVEYGKGVTFSVESEEE